MTRAVDIYLQLLSQQVNGEPESSEALMSLAEELGRSPQAIAGKFVEISQALRTLEMTPLTPHAAPLDKGTRPVAFNVMEEVRSRRSRGELDWIPVLPADQRVSMQDDEGDQLPDL